MFSTLGMRVQTIAASRSPARAGGPPGCAILRREARRNAGGSRGVVPPGGYSPLGQHSSPGTKETRPQGAGSSSEPGRWVAPVNPGPRANLRDHDNLVGLSASVALRDLELDPLPLFEGAVAIRLDSREVDENVLATVDGDKAVSLVRVEPLDGALSHSKQLPNCARDSSPALANAEPVDREP